MSYGVPNTRLHIGNLSWDTTEETLRGALEQNGRTVTKVDIKTDAKTGRSRGFAFVDLSSDEEVQAAIAELNGTDLDGRPIKIGSAKEQKLNTGGYGKSDKGGGGYGDRGGYGGGGGGGRGGRGGRW
jgi:RNA recognition motif-containing protein